VAGLDRDIFRDYALAIEENEIRVDNCKVFTINNAYMTPLEALDKLVGLPVLVKTKLKNNKEIFLAGKLVRTEVEFGREQGVVEFPAPNKKPMSFTYQKIQKA
jgi:hypothetical protein